MRSDRRPRSKFVFGALVSSFVMILVAAALFVHVKNTRRWLAQIKAASSERARDRAQASNDVVPGGCPDSRPVLIGFDDKGRARCRAVSSQTCPSGQYISSLDPKTLEIHCSDAGADVACAPGTYITEFMWLGENRVSYSCFPRLDPFVAWKFEPTLGSKGGP